MGSFKEHGVLIYLSKDLYSGWIRLQADKNLGRTYAGLLPFVEGLYRLGYISEVVYQEHIKKYSVPLDAKPLAPEQLKEKEILDAKDRHFKIVLDQWDIHPDSSWRVKKIADAEKFPNLEHAKLLVVKGKECDIIEQAGSA